MHLLILGLILVVGILVYYIMTTSPSKGKSSDEKKAKIKRENDPDEPESKVPENLRKEDNVIFLPSMNKDAAAADKGQAPDGEQTSDEDNH